MKLFIVLAVLFLSLFLTHVFALDEPEIPFATESTKGAKINLYYNERISGSTERRNPILLVHGFNSSGETWRKEENNYVKQLTQDGYDVIVVDMRGNNVDVDGDHKVDMPVVGDSWNFGVRDLGDDVGIALQQGISYLNTNLPDRNYIKADIITHSTGALAVTSYSRSQGLVTYRNNIDTVIELAPPNNGSTSMIANIKETLQRIPSVFTQSMAAYEYGLEILGGKVWIPGGRIESENLRKELVPDSLFLKSIQGLGPEEGIKTFIAIGDKDWVVGDWSPVIEERKDIGYEYFIGLDHMEFCDSELVIKALLDRLEKGADSDFFNRYEPYRSKNLTAFLLSPGAGIDHPDDTYDIVTFARNIDITPRELFNLYLRIAGKKGKENILKYWKAVSIFEEAQRELDDGASEEEIIDKWHNELGIQNEILRDSFGQAQEEYLECPDIAILANGYYTELLKLIIEKLREPVRIVGHTFTPSILQEQKILIIPTGGLSGLSASAIFKKKLSEYVKNGGTIVCLTQQYGHDFNALPAQKLKGYGWQEDALCYSKAAYIENFHQMLSSQVELSPDVKIDGYFTGYPENTKVLLRRTKNLMPAMLMYEYGNGLVIAATLYSDWGYANGQTGESEIDLVRSLVKWCKNSKSLPEYETGKDLEKTIDVTKDFAAIKMILKSPGGEILDETISDKAQYSLKTVLSKPGIYCVDYILYNSDNNEIQPETEGFYFCYSLPPEGSVENPDLTFNITTDSEYYIKGSEALFSFHIKNNTGIDETIKCKAELPLHEIRFTESINVPAGEIVSFDKKIIVNKTENILANFYSSSNRFLGRSERGINVVEAKVSTSLKTNKMQYTPGEAVLIETDVTNHSETHINLSLVLNIVDSNDTEIFYDTKDLRLERGENYEWNQDLEIPKDAPRGIYKIRLSAFSNNRLVGQSGGNIDIPCPLLFDKSEINGGFFDLLTIETAKLVYQPGESILAKVVIDNKGKKIDNAVLSIKVMPTVEKGELCGIIKDDKGNPIKGAMINSVYTNKEGKYRLENLTKGELLLTVRAHGFDGFTSNIEILPGGNELDIELMSAKYGNLFGAMEDAIGSYVLLEPVAVSGSEACTRGAVIAIDNNFEFRQLPVGTYSLEIQPEGINETIEVLEGDNLLNIPAPLPSPQEESVEKDPPSRVDFEEIEPNNSFENANGTGLGINILGAIYDYGDEDYFTFQVDYPLILDIALSDAPDDFYPHLIIHDSKGGWMASTAAFPGEELTYSLEIAESGQYFLHLKDRYNSFSSTERYLLAIDIESGSDDYEPNADFEKASNIDIRQEVTATMFPEGDQDYFTFDIENKGIFYIKMLNVPQGFRPSIKVYDSSGKVISQKGGSDGEEIELETEITETGRYYLMAKDWYSNFSSLDSYSFRTYFINAIDEYEPNDSKENAVPVNFYQDYFAGITAKGDLDFYKLSIPDAGKTFIYLKDVPSNIRPYIKLYKEGRETWIDSVAGSAGEDISIELDASEPSNYFIQVQDRYNSESSHLEYRFFAAYVPEGEYLPEDLELFKQEITLKDIKGKEEIDIEFPGINEAGKYYIVAALDSNDNDKDSQAVETFYVGDPDVLLGQEPLPDIEVSYIKKDDPVFSAGGKAIFTFKAENSGEKGDMCKIDFKFNDLYSHTLSEFLEPETSKELKFEFTLPVDLAEGIYQAEYVFEGEKRAIDLNILGLRLEAEAQFKDDIFKIIIHNKGAIKDIELFAEVRCGGFEDKKDFVLNDSQELSFNISNINGETKIYYGVYFKTGKSIYLDSLSLEEEEKKPAISIVKAACDKECYENGEPVLLEWKINSPENLHLNMVAELIGPDFDSKKVVDEDLDLKEGINIFNTEILPDLAKPGMYKIIYKFYLDGENILEGALFFDVGNEIKISLFLDADECFENENIGVNVGIFTSTPLEGELRLLLDDETAGTKEMSLDGYEEFYFKVKSKEIGEHKICARLLYGDIKDSDKKTFLVLPKSKPNHSPVLFSIGNKEVLVEEALEFLVEATDIDRDALSYSAEDLPVGASFDVIQRKFRWLPGIEQKGEYYVTFFVSDGKLVSSERVRILVKDSGTLPPETNQLASPMSGMAPLEVYFNSDSVSDPGIVKYEWDFDGKGIYDFSSLNTGNCIFVYTGEGIFNPSLRVTNIRGLTNVYTVAIVVERNPDAPIVSFEAIPPKGFAPCKVHFQGKVSFPDDICRYEWDFNGDGVYEARSAESGEIVTTYGVHGIYDAEFRAINSKGLSDSKTVRIEIFDPSALDIEPVISKQKGNVPIEVDFDAIIDSVNGIQKYQWDFEGDGDFDFTSTISAKTAYTYYKPGLYEPVLRVTDTANIAAEERTELRFGVSDPDNILKGEFIVTSKKGKVPLTMNFSFDWDIDPEDASYFWDFNGDDVCDIVTDLPEAEYTYYDSGLYFAKAKVVGSYGIIASHREAVYIINGKHDATVNDNLKLNERKNVLKNKADKIELSDKTSLILPAGILESDDTVTVDKIEEGKINKKIIVNGKENIISAGEYREYKFDNHKEGFDIEMTISIPYEDQDDDGIVDNRDINELTLDAYWLDEDVDRWKMLSDVLVFPRENLVTIKTNHFSLFGIAGEETEAGVHPSGNSSEGGNGEDGSGDDINCFIATAAFGTPMAEEVRILCGFRDDYLLRFEIGRGLVDTYYRFSPPLARCIKNSPFARFLIRQHIKLLAHVIRVILYCKPASQPGYDQVAMRVCRRSA